MYTIKKGYMEDRFLNIDVKSVIAKLKEKNRICRRCGNPTKKKGDIYQTFCSNECAKKYIKKI